jgi:hypothetical protein
MTWMRIRIGARYIITVIACFVRCTWAVYRYGIMYSAGNNHGAGTWGLASILYRMRCPRSGFVRCENLDKYDNCQCRRIGILWSHKRFAKLECGRDDPFNSPPHLESSVPLVFHTLASEPQRSNRSLRGCNINCFFLWFPHPSSPLNHTPFQHIRVSPSADSFSVPCSLIPIIIPALRVKSTKSVRRLFDFSQFPISAASASQPCQKPRSKRHSGLHLSHPHW